MVTCRVWGLALLAAVAAAGATSSPAVAASGPPACAKIVFRALPSGQNDGEQEAGIYTSRFTHLELKAMVKSGEAQDYYVSTHNKRLAPLSGAVPAAAASCAKEKKMPAPAKAAASCTGQHFATVIVHSGKQKIVLLYGQHDREWQYCSAGTIGDS